MNRGMSFPINIHIPQTSFPITILNPDAAEGIEVPESLEVPIVLEITQPEQRSGVLFKTVASLTGAYLGGSMASSMVKTIFGEKKQRPAIGNSWRNTLIAVGTNLVAIAGLTAIGSKAVPDFIQTANEGNSGETFVASLTYGLIFSVYFQVTERICDTVEDKLFE